MKTTISLLALVSALGSTRAAQAQSQGLTPGKVLVSKLDAVEVPEAIAEQAAHLVAEAIAARAGWTVVTFAEARDLMTAEQTQQLVGCKSDATCLASATKVLASEWVVSGSLGMMGLSVTINLALTETATQTVKNRVSAVGVRPDALHDETRALVAELFAWEGGEAAAQFALDPSRPLSFAVFDLQASGVEPSLATNLTQMLAGALKAIPGASVIGRDDIVTMLSYESDKQLLGCTDASCLAEIGGALGVSYLTAGHVGRVAETYVISLRLLDPQTASVLNRVTESFTGDPEQLFGALRHGVRRLVGGALDRATPGALAVTTNEPAAKLFVDGLEQGALPRDPLAGLAPGRHALRVSKPDFLEWASDVYIDPGRETALRARLLPVPTEWYESWLFWTLTGAGVAAATGTTIGIVLGVQGQRRNTNSFPGLDLGLPVR